MKEYTRPVEQIVQEIFTPKPKYINKLHKEEDKISKLEEKLENTNLIFMKKWLGKRIKKHRIKARYNWERA